MIYKDFANQNFIFCVIITYYTTNIKYGSEPSEKYERRGIETVVYEPTSVPLSELREQTPVPLAPQTP
ncbi:hypothetical protein J4232_06465 [Candidatus Woesearchaeota archaeon]|nr:hypothetical protein [Candidatus Woesearchaeota archaeon]